jgi:hypothetical protein
MNVELLVTALTHTIYGRLRTLGSGATPEAGDRDRGAVSLEQVLWFVAAGVAVAVIAGILWGKIRDEANRPVVSPSAP